MHLNFKSFVLLLLLLTSSAAIAQERFEKPNYKYPPAENLVGGPLSGVELPLWPTQHGEEPGYPGAIPDLQDAHRDNEGYLMYGKMDMAPEMHLYPDAVEHFRGYWFKYCPQQSYWDRQSQIEYFKATELMPAASGYVEQFAEPVYWHHRHQNPRNTGYKREPVPVVRANAQTPAFDLDLGELPIGLYVVRVIAAVPTEQVENWRKTLLLSMRINDKLDGSESYYKNRCGYVDQFYSVAEFYFHAVEKRHFKASIKVETGTQVDLLIHGFSLDDQLVGMTLRPIKKAMETSTEAEREALRKETDRRSNPTLPKDERFARDELFWKAWPDINIQLGYNYGPGRDWGYQRNLRFGVGGQEYKDGRSRLQQAVPEEWGKWDRHNPRDIVSNVENLSKELMYNEKLGLSYTMDDLHNVRPLPEPYPYKDDGTGLRIEVEGQDQPQYFTLVADAVTYRARELKMKCEGMAEWYHKTGDPKYGRDAAILLIRIAYDAPAMDPANCLCSLLAENGSWGRDYRCRQRNLRAHPWFPDIKAYDQVFDVIKGNEELAESVSRFIPWVQSSDDLIMMLDSRLVQNVARRYLRYHAYWANDPAKVLESAVVLGDSSVTYEWLDWLFSRTYIYPLPPTGMQQLLITGNSRDGIGYIGSYYYGYIEDASRPAANIEAYIESGGMKSYDLRDPKLFPKPLTSCYAPIRQMTAGQWFPRVADVGGPDKTITHCHQHMPTKFRRGWRWSKDPIFAWYLVNWFEREHESDQEWKEMTDAAATFDRPPHMAQRSRVLVNWMAALESGQEHDDLKLRRSAFLRVGQGYGHHHHDTLDLQLHAHGYPMTIDGGQRPGYSYPNDREMYVHNTVEVDEGDWLAHSWTRTLSDPYNADVRNILAEAVPPLKSKNVNSYRRQIALIDVEDEANPGNSYTFDVFRISGGKRHTYSFHGAVEDEFQANAISRTTRDTGMATEHQRYLRKFKGDPDAWAGSAPSDGKTVARWRMTREGVGNEERMHPEQYDEASPRKFTQLHLLGQPTDAVFAANAVCHKVNYSYKCLMVQRVHEQDSDTVFPAVIEPYQGTPFIDSIDRIKVNANTSDANQAVAVRVKTKTGRTDHCLSGGDITKQHRAEALTWQGEWAFEAADNTGLQMAQLTRGNLLQTQNVLIKTAIAERTANVIEVDYAERFMLTNQVWPTFQQKDQFDEKMIEVGLDDHWTSYMITAMQPSGNGMKIQMRNGGDLFASSIKSIDPETGTVTTVLGMPHDAGNPSAGMHQNLVASNKDQTKFWRAENISEASTGNYRFQLTGGTVTENDFGKNGELRFWEYGVGDVIRQETSVTLQRKSESTYTLQSNVDVTIGLRASSIHVSDDGQTWRKVNVEKQGDLAVVNLKLSDIGQDQLIHLQVQN